MQCEGVWRPLSTGKPGKTCCSGRCDLDRLRGWGYHVRLGSLDTEQAFQDKMEGGAQNPAGTLLTRLCVLAWGFSHQGKKYLFLNYTECHMG